MTNINRRSLMALIGGAALAGPFVARAQSQASRPLVKSNSARDRIRERHFPNVLLTTHEGKTVRFYDDLIKDKIVVINFMYVKCDGVCPGITANLVKLQKLLGSRLGRDIFMYSFTLKPEQDSAGVLSDYAKGYREKQGGKLLQGTPKDMELLRRKLGFTDPDPNL